MRGFLLALSATLASAATIARDVLPVGAAITQGLEARSPYRKGQKDSWGCNKPEYRHKVTIRASKNETDDISQDLLWAFQKANHGGTVHLKKGSTYIIGQKLDLSFLNDVHLQLEGELKFTDDIEYWQKNYFYYDFQRSITWVRWSGEKLKIYSNSGAGVLNGNGQAWYNGFAGREILDESNTYYRPILFVTENATQVSVSGITMLNSPVWTNFLVNSNDISFDNVYIEAQSNNASALPKNTDGWDTLNVSGISVTNSRVNIGDDCFSPKPNTSDIYVKDLWCNGTHGVSMGSIGQYPGQLDYIKDAYIENITMLNSDHGGRLKVWAGPNRGYGFIDNITYNGMYVENVDWPVVIDACYFNIETEICAAEPSKVNITNILFKNIHGITSGKEGKNVASLVCSPAAVCENIRLQDIDLRSPEAPDEPGVVLCDGIADGIGVPCVSPNSNSTEA